MEVDLQKLRQDIEDELKALEQRKSALEEQLGHIESVEKIASGNFQPDELDEAADSPDEPGERDSSQADKSKSWFRR